MGLVGLVIKKRTDPVHTKYKGFGKAKTQGFDQTSLRSRYYAAISYCCSFFGPSTTTKPSTSVTIEIDPLASPDPDRPCVMWDKAFAYEGDDHIVGLSPVSCAAAFENWRVTLPTPVDLA